MSEQQTIPTPADLYATYHQRDRLGLWSNRLLRLSQRLQESRMKLDAAIQIVGE